MKIATLEQINKIMPDNMLSYPIYQNAIKFFRRTFFYFGMIEDRIASPKPIRFIEFDRANIDSMTSPSQIEGLKTVELEEDNRTDATTTRRIIQAMAANPPVTGDTDEQSPLGTLGLLITIARRERNLTMEELATMTNLDFETLFLIESGLASMDLVSDKLEKICNFVGLDYHKTSSYIIDLILR